MVTHLQSSTTKKQPQQRTQQQQLKPQIFSMSCQFFLHNNENKVWTNVFIDTGSSSTILHSKTADELRLQKETRQQVVLEGAHGTDKKLVTQRQQKFQIWKTTNATISNRCMLWKTSMCQNWGSTRETLPESMTTLDTSICQLWIISKAHIWLDRTTLTLSQQWEWKKDHRQHQARVFSNLVGLFLELIQYWMTAKHNIQCIIMFCFAATASNKTMTSSKKLLIGEKQRQCRWDPKPGQVIQKYCLSTRYLSQHAWDNQMDVMKRDISGKTGY